MNEQKGKELAGYACGKGKSVFNHISLSIRAFLRLEVYRLRTGISLYEVKARIIRDAISAYLANPIYLLKPTA